MRADAAFNSLPEQITVTSPVLKNGEPIPRNFSIEGHGAFPGICWDNLPDGTKSILFVVEDNDAPLPMPFVHGLAYNINPELQCLPEASLLRESANALLVDAGVK